jgi:hypothetical protein
MGFTAFAFIFSRISDVVGRKWATAIVSEASII